MKKILLSISAIIALSNVSVAQATKRNCVVDEHHEFLKQTRKGYEQAFYDYQIQTNKYLADKAASKLAAMPTVTIPVVVHVLYQNATENISDAQAASQVQVLNDDFAKLNSDANLVTQPSFSAVAAGANIRFCLAQRDPQGVPTTGVVHYTTSVGTFGTNDAVKNSAQGGANSWDVTKYVNIWVCDLGSSLLGYGEFPTTNLSNTWGLVLNYRYTGTGGSAQSPFDLGRTGTHEFGHCFNLFHIWGCANPGDQCADTPPQSASSGGCFPAGSVETDACTTGGDGIMWMNYMDYTDDACMYMFTAGQVDRMESVVNTAPWNILQSSDGCTPVILSSLDANLYSVLSPANGLSTCTNSVNSIFSLRNMGSVALTSATINYKLDGGATQTYTWTGNLASLATTNVTLTPLTGLSASAHTFSVWVTAPNGGTDANATNDGGSSSFTITSSSIGTGLPFTENFENTTFPPAGWALQKTNTLDAAYTWTRFANTTGITAGSTGVAKMDNYAGNNDITGQKDALRTPALDFSAANSTLKVKFDVSHRRYSTTDIDTLNVYVSTNCGGTWNRIYSKGGTQLATVTATLSTAYTPTSTAQWRRDSVNLTPYAGLTGVYVKFESRSGWGNNLYLDNININYNSTVGLHDLEQSLPSVSVNPNPSNGVFNVALSNVSINANSTITVVNAIGQTVANNIKIKGITENQSIDLSHLPNGVYYMLLQSDNNKSVTKKIVISK